MGKKDDWCSCAGLQNRKAGLDHKEKACTKICYAIMYSSFAAIFAAISGITLSRSENATKVDNMMNDFFEKMPTI